MVSVLTENWTMTDPRDIRGIVRMAQEAEDAGFDMVMVSDHVLLGPSAGSQGRMDNPRDYAMPGNQDPFTAWPSNIVLLSAVAAATTRVRIGAIALIAPLRHPLVLAHDLATLDLLSEGRLVIQPTVSWHKDEYDAIGVPWGRRAASSMSSCASGAGVGPLPRQLRRRVLHLRRRLPRAKADAPRRPRHVVRR
jgi:alkanesulfonate monooxygenase SsuD/methylene tetrahydromethanopterin reductase-like flavin-dependent oxidoreductase (luciferase family)